MCCNMDKQFILSPRALAIINNILEGLIRSGSKTANITLFVSADAQLATEFSIPTDFGELAVKISNYSPKGLAYIMGNPGHIPREFVWVSRGGK
jgi:hypothetical protein